MAHGEKTSYAAKHPAGSQPEPKIVELVKNRLENGKLPCAAAHAIAEALQIAPAEIGKTVDLLEIRVSQCQLGLFGHTPKKRLVTPAASVAPELRQAITHAANEKGIPCLMAWKIAEQFGLSRLDVSSACEAIPVKICACQLGSF